MRAELPPSYKPGVDHLEGLTGSGTLLWLQGELLGGRHVLAGQADDFPVQAILNHYPYLSLQSRRRLDTAVESLVTSWKSNPDTWPESSTYWLLDLAARLPVTGVKSRLQSLSESTAFSQIHWSFQPAVYQTIAELSHSGDRKYWNRL